MTATVHEIAAGFGGNEAREGSFLPDSGAADRFGERSAGLSDREWAVVAVAFVAMMWAAVGGFCARGWVEAPVAACAISDAAELP